MISSSLLPRASSWKQRVKDKTRAKETVTVMVMAEFDCEHETRISVMVK